MNYHDLTLREKIGQMVMVGLKGNHINKRIEKLITKYKIGGILLFRKNFDTYDQMINLVNELKELNKNNKVPLFIAIDQEGGRVNRFPSEIKRFPSANKLASLNNIETVIKSTQITANLLKNSGFNMNFAPVLDIKRFDNSHAIGDRCYADTKEKVSEYGIAVMKEFQKNNILSVIKHFPGHGATTTDSHFFLPIIKSNMEKLENEDVYPFLQAIKNDADALLISHLLIKHETGFFPASLSRKFIIKYLRKKYRYNGLIITDDLKMRSIRLLYGPTLAVKKAFKAGNDIVLFRFNSIYEKMALNKIFRLAKHGKIKESHINKSTNRILKIKEKYNISDKHLAQKIDLDIINNQIDEIKASLM